MSSGCKWPAGTIWHLLSGCLPRFHFSLLVWFVWISEIDFIEFQKWPQRKIWLPIDLARQFQWCKPPAHEFLYRLTCQISSTSAMVYRPAFAQSGLKFCAVELNFKLPARFGIIDFRVPGIRNNQLDCRFNNRIAITVLLWLQDHDKRLVRSLDQG